MSAAGERNVTVYTPTGEAILALTADVRPWTVADVCQRLPGGVCCKLLHNDRLLEAACPLSALADCTSAGGLILSCVRMNPWLDFVSVSGINPVQDIIPGLMGVSHCLSLASIHKQESWFFKIMRRRETINQVAMSPPLKRSNSDGALAGVIYSKSMCSQSVYKYDIEYRKRTTVWQIAEGFYRIHPGREGEIELHWTGLAEASIESEGEEASVSHWGRVRSDSPINEPVHVLVPPSGRFLRLADLFKTWSEGRNDEEPEFRRNCVNSQCRPIKEGVSMPDVTASGLRELGFDPATLDFWTAGSSPRPSCGPGLDSIRKSLAMPKKVKVFYQRKSGQIRQYIEATAPDTLDALTRMVTQLLAQASPPLVGVSLRFYKINCDQWQFLGIDDDCDVLAIERGDYLFALARPLVRRAGSQRVQQIVRRRRREGGGGAADGQESRLRDLGGECSVEPTISGQHGLRRGYGRGGPARAQWRGQLRSCTDRRMSDSRHARLGRRGSWQRRAPMAAKEGGAKTEGRRRQS